MSYPGMTDLELVDGLLKQDKNAIQYLVRTYGNKIIRTSFSFVTNMEDAEDLSQDVFIEILKSAGNFRKNSSLGTWIYRITVNKSLDHLRKQKRKLVMQQLSTILHLSPNDPDKNLFEPGLIDTRHEEEEKRKILDQAISSLPENQKIAFILNKYDERSYQEISEIMNVSLSAVESLIHRAKLNLQKKLSFHFSEYAAKKR
jgi:RNA polymerase sigma-70 factor, ECF subfamily